MHFVLRASVCKSHRAGANYMIFISSKLDNRKLDNKQILRVLSIYLAVLIFFEILTISHFQLFVICIYCLNLKPKITNWHMTTSSKPMFR